MGLREDLGSSRLVWAVLSSGVWVQARRGEGGLKGQSCYGLRSSSFCGFRFFNGLGDRARGDKYVLGFGTRPRSGRSQAPISGGGVSTDLCGGCGVGRFKDVALCIGFEAALVGRFQNQKGSGLGMLLRWFDLDMPGKCASVINGIIPLLSIL